MPGKDKQCFSNDFGNGILLTAGTSGDFSSGTSIASDKTMFPTRGTKPGIKNICQSVYKFH